MVLFVSLGMLASSSLAGNVLCFGEDGHTAIEASHGQRGALSGLAHFGGDGPTELSGGHGPCNDVGGTVAVAVRRAPADVPGSQLVPAAPWSDAAPCCLGVLAPPESRPCEGAGAAAAPPAGMACLRSVVLLI